MTIGISTIIDEPVRGAIGDPRGLQTSGLEGARRHVRGELPVGPIHRLASAELVSSEGKRVAMATSSALVVPGGVRELMRGTPPEKLLGIR